MVKDYMRFLAVHVINESKIISYRMLSRELKVHCNAAKRMLYEFHTHENKKKPGSVHATYLLYGTQSAKSSPTNGASQQDGEDISMTSSPFMSSSMPQDEDMIEEPPVKVMTIVREENLEATKFAHEDPLVFNEKYGVIKNSGVKRRTGPRPPPPPAVVEPAKPTSYRSEPKKPDTTAKAEKAPEKPISSAPASKPEIKPSTQPKPPDKKLPEKKPPLKKDTSNIFESFGKTKAPTPKLTKEETDTSTLSVGASGKEDEPMRDASESEQEEDFMPSTTASKPKPKSTRPSRSEREETIRKMMDEDSDEEMSNAPSKEATPAPAPPAKEKTPTPEPAATVSGGRRRGRRKVIRRKTMKDEEGYIITQEEPTWESFSEDEPARAPTKKLQLPTSSTTSAKGGKKSAGPKAGQGNIMNFFGKR
ncbi:hypothetical protein G7Y79_00073g098370 [Physcia stellaris]|nr:hypothetical protein G7Y79_00073g098370 [Physcia stellaris]